MTAYTSRPEGSRLADVLATHAQLLSIAGFFLIMVVIFSTLSPVFLTPGNLLNVLRQAAPILIVAVAMTFVITTGGIDLSVGSSVALVNALAAILIQAGVPWQLVVPVLLAIGAGIGAVQGWFIAFQGIQPFIVTLAGLSALRGIALLMTEGFSVPIPTGIGFVQIGRGWFAGVPAPAWIAVAAAVAGFVALSSMRFGRYVTAIGANQEAARRAGIPTRAVLLRVYVLTGLASAVAGIVIAARLGSGSSNAAVGFELDVIAGVVLGGTSLMGGRGSMLGTILGALTIAVIGNGLILAHVSPFFTQIVTGSIILLAVWLNARVFSRLAAGRRRRT
ncbi:ABC transporter permease [Chthonobacter rhizosphaerae]|uniref:ABC transporter permease n=1 Tax=Chthonobacter rhizosphaerae TaxID=2735553 RepID=UPI0015EE3AB3|nr:ABC transporter permease [Chthonobacter rhizosphaerae]